MCPYLEVFNIKVSVFPYVILLALFLTGVVYIKSKQYPKMFLLDMLRKVVPILIGAAIGARLTSAITLLSTSRSSTFIDD